jgi:hypothetical protein
MKNSIRDDKKNESNLGLILKSSKLTKPKDRAKTTNKIGFGNLILKEIKGNAENDTSVTK